MSAEIQAFQAKLFDDIPAVKFMQLSLDDMSDIALSASAPLLPNINDKGTLFGGSSGALMTVCGWSFIKIHLERQQIYNDVVIHRANTTWNKALAEDFIINTQAVHAIDWQQLCHQIKNSQQLQKIELVIQILNQKNEICSEMTANFVILRKS